MNKTILATFLIATFTGACAVDDASKPAGDPRDGVYTVQSEVVADVIDSEVYRDGVLVAVATLDADANVVTLVESGKEMVAAPPEGYDPRAELEQYHRTVSSMSTALELTEASDTSFRSICPYIMFDGADGSVCAVSWCSDGSDCIAMDCGPNIWGSGEILIMSGCD